MLRQDLPDWLVRPATRSDLDALDALARQTGGGFTNLPPNREALERRLERSVEAFAREDDEPSDDPYLLVLEHRPTGRVLGTAAIFAAVGQVWPFYSYKVTTIALVSRELGRTFRTRVLHLVNDFDGATEVGGLFLAADARSGGLGRLLARARYLFIARHRRRFADRTLAELRGVIRADGSSPFWDGLARRFFGMDFVEADRFNSLHGTQFIADLMPKYPVYEALLPESAAAVIGVEHPDGTAARHLLEWEGFAFNAYIDIFDGGPTLDTPTDRIRTVAEARPAVVGGSGEGPLRLIAAGRGAAFRVVAAPASSAGEVIHPAPAAGIAPGTEVLHVLF
ncbi:arginine N-succinyltransferase [Thermaurantiacus sp.]